MNKLSYISIFQSQVPFKYRDICMNQYLYMPPIAKKIVFFSFCLALVLNYTNPVQGNRDSPDPGVIYSNGEYYAVTTMGWDGHYFPIWKSSTGINFTQVGWIFPSPPSWTACCSYWAPEIHNINGKFVAYYTAKDKSNKLCIGAAISDNILGPYVDKGAPLITNSSEGLIDATILRQGVNNYLVYKVDGNAHGHPTEFWAVLLDPTGMATRGNPVLIMKNDQAWQRGIIEGQWFVKEAGVYYLFYSGCGYNNDCYAVGIAKSNNALGPYTKNPNNPILKTRSPMTVKSWEGPGHCSVVKDEKNGKWLMFYHAWPHGGLNTKRLMLLDEVKFTGGWATVNDGSPSQNEKVNPGLSLTM